MNRPASRSLLAAAAGLVLTATTHGATTTANPPAQAADPERPTPRWTQRLANAPKKLAFWQKDAPETPPATPAAVTSTAPATKKKSPAQKPSAAPAKPSAATAVPPPPVQKRGKPVAAPAAPQAAATTAEEAPAKPSFFSKLPAFSFRKSSEPVTDESIDAPSSTPAKKSPPSTPAVAAASDRAVDADQAIAIPAEPRPSLWERMTAAVTPKTQAPTKPATAPIPKGLAALGVTEPDPDTFVITKDQSPFFLYGPQQATPPDAYLSTGTIVTLQSRAWGWATIQLEDGRSGLIDRSALRPALLTDLIPSRRPGDPLFASLSPTQIKRSPTPSFILPAADMPDLPSNADSLGSGPAGNPLLLPFLPDDISDSLALPPLPGIPPLPEPDNDTSPSPDADPAGEEATGDTTDAAPTETDGAPTSAPKEE